MIQAQRVLPDLTTEAAEFGSKISTVICPIVWYHLGRAFPDGVRIRDLAGWHNLTWQETVDLVAAAEAAGKIKLRRLIDGGIQFVWLTTHLNIKMVPALRLCIWLDANPFEFLRPMGETATQRLFHANTPLKPSENTTENQEAVQ
jgi:hypothetical protein